MLREWIQKYLGITAIEQDLSSHIVDTIRVHRAVFDSTEKTKNIDKEFEVFLKKFPKILKATIEPLFPRIVTDNPMYLHSAYPQAFEYEVVQLDKIGLPVIDNCIWADAEEGVYQIWDSKTHKRILKYGYIEIRKKGNYHD